MSWKQRALEVCEKHNIDIEDQSSLTEYRVTMQTSPGHVLWETEAPDRTVVRSRKGHTKAKIWYDVYNIAICGTICNPFCAHRKP